MTLNGDLTPWLFLGLFGTLTILGIWLGMRLFKRPQSSTAAKVIGILTVIFSLLVVPIAGGVTYGVLVSYVIEIDSFDSETTGIIGSVVYETSDGQTINVDINDRDYYVVNVTDYLMMNDKVMYGIGFDMTGPTEIPPHTFQKDYSAPDYYPWESPPDEISVSEGIQSETMNWYFFAADHPEY